MHIKQIGFNIAFIGKSNILNNVVINNLKISIIFTFTNIKYLLIENKYDTMPNAIPRKINNLILPSLNIKTSCISVVLKRDISCRKTALSEKI